MRIKRLKISDYKNIKDVDLSFKSNLITLMVGQNGLGKSNLLEAIALIFRDLDLIEKEEQWEEWAYEDNQFSFEIWYESKNVLVWVKCWDGVFRVAKDESGTGENLKIIDFADFKKDKNLFLPDYILGYYSGENKRIDSYFKTHALKREHALKSNNPRDGQPALGRMFFSQQNYGELLFFALWVFKDTEPYKEKIQQLLGRYLNINLQSTVLIAFNNPPFAKSYPERNADNLLSNIEDSLERPFWGLTGEIDQLLNALWNNNSAYATPIAFEDETFDPNKNKNGFVSFNNLDYSILTGDLKDINTPIYLFDILEAAYKMDIIYRIRGEINKGGAAITHDFKEFSEGEQQLLTVLGLIMMAGKDDCLFLLDEPDTHLNPQWQRNYVNLLNEFNLNGNGTHIMMATHSPLIVQAAERADILLYKRGESGNIEIVNNDDLKIHNWRIDQVLASEYFDFDSTRPPDLDDFMKKRLNIIRKGKLSPKDEIELKLYENAIGYLPTGETMEELKSNVIIKEMADKLKNDQG
ncbi:MAG: AAA family ATPase [Janthinobacterium sp.]|jgi:predicted ATPase